MYQKGDLALLFTHRMISFLRKTNGVNGLHTKFWQLANKWSMPIVSKINSTLCFYVTI